MPTNLMPAASAQKVQKVRWSMPASVLAHQPVGHHRRAVFELHGMQEQQPEDADRDPDLEGVLHAAAPRLRHEPLRRQREPRDGEDFEQ